MNRKIIFVLLALLLISTTIVFAGTIQLPKTGQTKSYATGDDGDLEKGVTWPSPRFTDNGNGTVTDNLTALMWTKNANAPGPSICGSGTYMTWQGALDYVKCLNSNNYLGYSDWRLPNRKELRSLVDYSNYNPALPTGHPFTNVQSYNYWSSSTSAGDTSYAWSVDMWSGGVGYGSKGSDGNYVWPVRSGQSGSFGNLSISGTVIYNSEGLKGVTITAGSKTATTDSSGKYTITGLSNGDYTVTPSMSGYTFSPSSKSVTISDSDKTGIDFTATLISTDRFSLSGKVTYNNAGLKGVTITVDSSSAVTDSKGKFSITGLSNGTYTVTSSKSGYTFSPPLQLVTIADSNQTGINFIATLISADKFSLSGKVTYNSAGLKGVTITVASSSAVTDSKGKFSITGLSNGTYTVTPSLSGYTFSPSSQSVTISDSDETGIDFTAKGAEVGFIDIGDLRITADSITQEGDTISSAEGNVKIGLVNGGGNGTLKVSGKVRIDTTSDEISSLLGTLYIDDIPGIGTVDLATGFSFKVDGAKLNPTDALFSLPASSLLIANILFGFEAEIDSISIESNTDVVISGSLDLPDSITNLLKDKAGTSIEIKELSVRISKTNGAKIENISFGAEIKEIKIIGTPLTLKDVKLDSQGNKLTIGGGFDVMGLFPSISGEITLKGGKLDAVTLAVGDLNIPIDTSPFFLQGLSGGVERLTEPPPIIKGTASFSGGPDILNYFTLLCFNDIGIEIDPSSYLKASGGAGLFCSDTIKEIENGAISSSLEATFDWKTSMFSAEGDLVFPFDIITGKSTFSVDPKNISGETNGKFKVPQGVPFVGGSQIDIATVVMNNKGVGGEYAPAPFLNIAFGIDWDIVKSRKIEDTIQYIHVGTNLEQLGYKSSSSFNKSLRGYAFKTSKDIVIPEGIETVIFRLTWDKGDTDFNLITPEGVKITPEYAKGNSEAFTYMKNEKEAWYGIKNPKGGTWEAEVTNPISIGNYKVEFYSINKTPSVSLFDPSGKVTASKTYTINWAAYDSNNEAKISLYYDTDNKGIDGKLIISDISEKNGGDSYNWDVSEVPAGIYYIYAILQDGKNSPKVAYSPGVIEIVKDEGLAPPENITLTASKNTITAKWNSINGANYYKIYYTDDVSRDNYKNFISIGANVTEYTLKDLVPGTTYRLALSSLDSNMNEGSISSSTEISTEQVAVGKISLNKKSIDFGTVEFGKTKRQKVSINSKGDDKLKIDEINVYGAGSKNIILSKLNLPKTLAPDKSLNLDINFKPTAYVDLNSVINIKSNDPLNPTYKIPIKGKVSLKKIFLSSPKKGEILSAGKQYNIQWISPQVNHFVLEYSTDDGKTWKKMKRISGNKSNYLWIVPKYKTGKSKCFVKIIGYKSSHKQAYVATSKVFKIKPSKK